MARERSISPRRETKKRHRSRSRSRDRERDNDRKKRHHDRSRSRSRHGRRSPRRDSPSKDRRSQRDHKDDRTRKDERSRKDGRSRRSRSRSRGDDDDVVFVGEQKPNVKTDPAKDSKISNAPIYLDAPEDPNEMMKMMLGFSSFSTTKGKKVANNDDGSVRITTKRKFRQYMNRVGGFNRPLANTQ